jgi:hypothetical protein
MKTFLGILIIVIVLVGTWFLFACQDDWCFVFDWQKARATTSFEDCVIRGFSVRGTEGARTCHAGPKAFSEPVRIVDANIRVTEPSSNEEIGQPLVIRGSARVFESVFQFRLRDQDGSILLQGSGLAAPITTGALGAFEVITSYSKPKGKTGVLEVFAYSAKDGSEIDKVVIPLRFKYLTQMTVSVFFGNTEKDPGGLFCEKVYPIKRSIVQTSAPLRTALEELLRGPTVSEKSSGYFTSLNPEVTIQSLVLRDGTIYADFNYALDFEVGGSCRVRAIRAQITETLKQYPSVKNVIISINGKTEDILQP